MQTNIKTTNGKKLWLEALVNSECTYIGIDKQLVKEEKIKIKPMNRLFKVFNADGTKNGEVTRFALLEVEINGYKEQIDTALINLNSTDIFLEYNWLVKYNPEVNWNTETIEHNIRICYSETKKYSQQITKIKNNKKQERSLRNYQKEENKTTR